MTHHLTGSKARNLGREGDQTKHIREGMDHQFQLKELSEYSNLT